MDLNGLDKHEGVGEKRYAMIFLDDYSRMKWIRFRQKKNNSPEGLLSFIADVAKQVRLNIGTTRTH